jgi:hypothetical protein
VIDHLVYAVPDLERAVDEMERRLGVRAAAGGRHPGLGTHNALLALGNGAYFELLAPDPEQPPPRRPRPFGLDGLQRPRLACWAVKAPDIEARAERSRAGGYDPGPVISLGRERPDGLRLQWRLTYRETAAADGLVPFLIDWEETPHPSAAAPAGCSLLSLRGEHPRPQEVQPLLDAMAVELPLTRGSAASLIAEIETPCGRVELR